MAISDYDVADLDHLSVWRSLVSEKNHLTIAPYAGLLSQLILQLSGGYQPVIEKNLGRVAT